MRSEPLALCARAEGGWICADHRPPDIFAQFILDVALAWAVAATATYHLVLLARWPGLTWYPLVLAALLAMATIGLTRYRARKARDYQRKGFWTWSTLCLLLLSLAVGSVNLFTLRPDADDFSYAHRALYALLDLSRPIALEHTAHDLTSLPPISPVHLLTSVEVTTAFVAHALGLPPLWALQVGLGFVVLSLVPLVYFLLFRFFGAATTTAFVGIGTVILFLAVNGDTHNDWGNFTLVRAWQGKCILIVLHLPLALLQTFRFIVLGRRIDIIRLHAVMYSGIGLSSSALFLLPFAIGVAAVSLLVVGGGRRRYLGRSMRVAVILIYPLLAYALVVLGLLPSIADVSVWTIDSRTLTQVLERVVSKRDLLLYAALGLAVMLASRRKQLTAALVLSAILVGVVLALPPTSWVLMKIVTPAAYWRLIYAAPVPLLAGLAAASLADRGMHPWNHVTRAIPAVMLVGVLAGVVLCRDTPALNRKVFSLPHGTKFHPTQERIVRAIDQLVPAKGVVLAPEGIVVVLGLIRPDIRFISTRPVETLHVFRNAAMQDEGEIRVNAQHALEACGTATLGAGSPPVAQRWPTLLVVVAETGCEEVGLGEKPDRNRWRMIPLDGYRVMLR